MGRLDDLLIAAITSAGSKPPDTAHQNEKNPWVGNAMTELVELIGERNFDFYESDAGNVRKV